MKRRTHRHRVIFKAWVPAISLLMFFAATSSPLIGQKLTPEELIARHLETVGTADARAAVRTRVISGTCHYSLRSGGGGGKTEGKAVLASEGINNLIAMAFGTPEYPYEKWGFDGKDFRVAYINPSSRSAIGEIFYSHNGLFKEGLIGGTLSTSWPLLDLAARNPKLEYVGLKKIGGRDLHELKYTPRKGSDFQISLFFDPQTFQHVRTQYQLVLSAFMGSNVNNSARQRASHYTITEDFSDFAKEKRLTLPHTYKLQLSFETASGQSQVHEWELKLTMFTFNQLLDAKSFNVTGT